MLRALLVAGLAALAAPAGSSGVIVVEEFGAGGAYTTIQGAVDASADGDIIYVKANLTGSGYAGFTITNKSLVVTGETSFGPNFPFVSGRVLVQNVAANKSVTIAHLRIWGNAGLSTVNLDGAALFVQQAAGAVRVQDCRLLGASGIKAHPSGYPAVILSQAANVAVANTKAEGGAGLDYCSGGGTDLIVGGAGSVALYAETSQCAWHDGEVRGGEGGYSCINGGQGGTGAYLFSGTTRFVHTDVHGGEGGWAIDFIVGPFMHPGDGGNAVYVESGASAVFVECHVVGGEGGVTYGGAGSPVGDDGDTFTGSGSTTLEPGPTRSLALPANVAALTPAQLVVRGPAGDSMLLFFAFAPGPLVAIPNSAPFMLALPAFGPIGLGAMPGAGTLNSSVIAPALPPGVPGVTAMLQIATFGPSNAGFSNMIAFTILDPTL